MTTFSNERCRFSCACSALKHVESGEYNPFEVVKTNILELKMLLTLLLTAMLKGIFSTDKAVYLINLYGATKLLAEKSL